MSETDEQFLDGAEYAYGHHMVPQHRARLFALARRGADAAAEIERLGRDYDTARDAHDRRVRELDAHCVEVARLRAEVERLRADLRLAVMSDSETCKVLEREVERLLKSRNRWAKKYNDLLVKRRAEGGR